MSRTEETYSRTLPRWRRPELIVLVRSRPEEAVLEVCKSNQGRGPLGATCHITGPGGGWCDKNLPS